MHVDLYASIAVMIPRALGTAAAARPLSADHAPISPEGRRLRTSDRVYDQLLTAIRTLALVPGQSLSETDLAEQLHVSRTPLREAIARLAENGLVRVVPQVGTTVSRIGLGDVAQAQFVRETLEIGAFAVACRRATRDTTVLRELLAQQRSAWAAQDFDAFFARDEALHEHLFVMSGYPGAWTAIQGMKVQLDRLRRLVPDPVTVAELIAEHEAIVDALEGGRVAAGQRTIRQHARRVLRYAPGLREQYPTYFED